MKNLLNKLSLVTILSVAGQSTFASDRWDNPTIESAESVIVYVPDFIEVMKKNFGDDLGYNSLSLSVVLGFMAIEYNVWFRDISDSESSHFKIRQNQYELVIQYFIDHGCDINEKIDLFKALQSAKTSDFYADESDLYVDEPDFYADESNLYIDKFKTNRFKTLFTVALTDNGGAMIHALLNKGATLDTADQLDVLMYHAQSFDSEFQTGSSLVTLFALCDETVQKEFLLEHPELANLFI
jgi:hypothetical protein